MKNGLKISIFALMILCSALVYSQTDDNANQIMQKINEALSQGDCDQAQKRYNVWKTFAETTDTSIVKRIAECNVKNKKQEAEQLIKQANVTLSTPLPLLWERVHPEQLMQQINETLSQGDKPLTNSTLYNQPVPVNTRQHPAEPDLVYVKGGTFWMGCSDEQGRDCYDDERPLHGVTLSDFYIGKYEVTQKQWQLIMGNNPSNFKGDNLPVVDVSWNDVQEFILRLNKATGKQYRLPTEAEWEYACRGGVQSANYKYSGSNNPNDVAWYNDNSLGIMHPVGTKLPNELGIYDMSGNVWEWCQDRYDAYSSSPQFNPMGASSGSNRVNRGGSFGGIERFVRVSSRSGATPVDSSFYILGFRLACSSNQSEPRFSQDE